MRVLFVLPVYEPARAFGGGVVTSLATLCRALAKLGVSVTVYATNASGTDEALDVPLGRPVDLGGVNVYYFKSTFGPKSMFHSTSLTEKLWQTVDQFNLVYVAAWFMWIGIEAARICQKKKVPMIAGIHGGFSARARKKSYLKKKLFRELFMRRALNSAAAVHLTCKVEQETSQDWLDNLPTILVPNAVDPEKFYPCSQSRSDFRARYRIPESAPVLISVSRFDWMKRVDLLIGALSRVKDWYLVCVGDDASGRGPALKRYAEHLGVSERIVWTGFLKAKDLCIALSAADLFSLISESENFGIVVVEAMMCGLPVMISRNVGVWEMINNQDFTIRADLSIESIAKSLSLFREKTLGSKIDKSYIRQVAIDMFSPQAVTKQFIREIQKFIQPQK